MVAQPHFLPEELRVYSTRGADITTGRTFVHAGRWYERLEDGEDGAVSFLPIADSEEDLRQLLLEQREELDEVYGDAAEMVRGEFEDRVPLEPYEEERSDQPPFTEQDPS
jgi:hypothetical protein